MKYYKGLGTSTGKEFREYFENKKIVTFNCSGGGCRDALDKVFNKSRAGDRKAWLGAYDRGLFLDTNRSSVTFSDFVGKEMIHFSKYDCDRSIPNLMDGLKTSQRKILYTALKRNLRSDIKVAQLSGSVSEISCYHHGEASLHGAIKGMAQIYVGSNNINLLEPKGQFGTRLKGGDDAASERYIHTRLSPITRALFPAADDAILRYLDDDGTPVEPVFYAPVIPLVLANGARGIGTGFSTDVPSYDPKELIAGVRGWLDGKSCAAEMVPYYEGFQGTVAVDTKGKTVIKGVYEVVSTDTLRVTELPVGFWTEDFKQLLETLAEPQGKSKKAVVKDYRDLSTDTVVDFTITLSEPNVAALHAESVVVSGCTCTGIEKMFKLCSVRGTNNMHLFDSEEKLRKFDTPQQLLEGFCVVRLGMYDARRAHLLCELEAQARKADNKQRFIQGLLDETIDLRRKNKETAEAELDESGFDRVDGGFAYLMRMPMDAVSAENIEALQAEAAEAGEALETLRAKGSRDLWREDLTALSKAYDEYRKTRVAAQTAVEAGDKAKGKRKRKVKKR